MTFPTQPRAVSYQAEGKSGEFFVTRSEDGPPVLRAECQKITDRSDLSETLIVKSLEEQAASIGYRTFRSRWSALNLGGAPNLVEGLSRWSWRICGFFR